MKLDVENSWIKLYPNRRYRSMLVDSEFSPHQREFHILALIEQGEVTVTYRNQSCTVQQHEAILIPAGEVHSINTSSMSSPVVNFHYIDTLDVIKSAGGLLMPEVELIEETKSTATHFSQTFFNNINQTIDEKTYSIWLKQLVGTLNTQLKQNNELTDVNINALVAAKNYIEHNWFESINLTDLAKQVNIDKWQLSRKFKPVFGITLFQHIHASRILKAKNMLSQQRSITDVALECGFCDQSHLTRCFKRFVGMSPNQWVKLVNNSQHH